MSSGSSVMSTESVMLKILECFSTGDVSAVTEFVSSDYLDHQGLDGNVIHGADGFAHVVGVARRDFSELEARPEDVITENDRVVARIRWSGVLADGTIKTRETIDIIHVADGRAVEHWGAEAWSKNSQPSASPD